MGLTHDRIDCHCACMTDSHVFEVTEGNFQEGVVDRSMTQPVLLDFWAAGCEPCKSFTPVLLSLAAEYGGAFALGTVDTEAEVELSRAFQVQSVPFCVLLIGGRPADAFGGALGEEELRSFLLQHGVESAGKADEVKLVEADEACLSAAVEAARRGEVAEAREVLTGFPEESPRMQEHDNLLLGLDFLSAEFATDTAAGRSLQEARQEFLAANYEAAMARLLDSVREDRSFGDGLARRAMLLCQGVVADAEMVDSYRRQLATLLY